jgi:hypothetical protein
VTTDRQGLRAYAWAVPLTAALPWLAAWLPAGRWWLPVALVAVVYPEFRRRVVRVDVPAAWRWAMVWTVVMSASVVLLTRVDPERAARTILHGVAYRDELFGWIRTGVGKEGSPALFLPEHALHLGAFVVLCWLSAGLLGLVLGALLTAYMSFFVGSLAAVPGSPWWGALVAWFPWSIARVMAFVLLGVLLARPVLVRRVAPWTARERTWFVLVAAGIGLDLLLKTLLAPTYGVWFARWLGQ